ncbi:hypothetical protein QR680_001380 [Steinernema hermaphroditum]|uniref:Uncharacterized protein n=1 Tax=Steinernema hermaphroditum TaxID=289476 RepID=A0AA39LFY6_9BILA|nr:hypothetical protein QR680_001380 [Steinernema hermaphroditum]
MGLVGALSDLLNTSEDGLRLLLSILAGYPLAAIYRTFVYNKTAQIQHLFFVAAGVLLYVFNCGYAIYHSLLSIMFAYAITNYLPGSVLSIILAHVTFLGHLLLGYWNAESEKYDMTWTTPFCIMTLRYIGLVMDVYDGQKPKEKQKPDQAKTAIVDPPSLLETAAFGLFFAGTFVGPQFTLSRFRSFVNGEFLDEKGEVRASGLMVSLRRFVAGVTCAVLHQWGMVWIPNSYFNSQEFFGASFFWKVTWNTIWYRAIMYRYCTAWLLTEGAAILAGIGYNGKKDGEDQWDGVRDLHITGWEFGNDFTSCIESFNVGTNTFAKNHIFRRLRWLGNKYLSHVVTLMYLAIWHGYHLGYFILFIYEFACVTAQEQLYSLIRRVPGAYEFLQKSYMRPVCWLFGRLTINISMAFGFLTFGLIKKEIWVGAVSLSMSSLHGFSKFCGENFWADGSFYNDSIVPNVSECFQHTVLVWAPALFLLILSPAFTVQVLRVRKKNIFKPIPWSSLFIIKLFSLAYLFANTIFVLSYIIARGADGENIPAVNYVYPVIRAITTAGLIVCIIICKYQGMVTSGIVHLCVVVQLIAGAPELYFWIQRFVGDAANDWNKAVGIAYLAYYPVVVLLSLLFCFADPRSEDSEAKKKNAPELDSSFISRLTLWWFNAIPLLGARKDLEVEDLFELNDGSTSEHLTPLWDKYWIPTMNKYLEQKRRLLAQEASAEMLNQHQNNILKDEHNKKVEKLQPPSVVFNLFKIFKYEFFTALLIKMVADTLQFANPFLLNELIGFVSDKDAKLWIGVAYAVLMFASSELRSFMVNYYFYIMFRMGVKIQTVLTAAVYKKTLRLSNNARRTRTVGEIVNLMAIDVERFQLITSQIQQYWSSPFQITLALIYLVYTLGVSALTGVLIMALFVPLNVFSSMIVKNWQMQQMKLKDERAKMCNEILNGIKVIKLYAWEPPMEEMVESIRKQELDLLKKGTLVRSVVDVFNTASPFLVAILTFATYTLSNPQEHILTAQIAFVSLTLFNQLRSPMTMIGLLIAQTVQAVVSNKRLKDFFVAEELDDTTIERTYEMNDKKAAVEIQNADFTWEHEEDMAAKSTISNANLTVPSRSLIAVVGRVGSGKSSLLSSLLGEMEKLRGFVGVNGKLAYVPQQAWIQNLTLRDNITFGKEFNKHLYNRVIEACALKPDLDILPQGDKTEIGEKGINLSGGQKARVSLARAVYQNYDVYLLDDPLSAVDSHVGKHIFDKVIGPNGLLRNKTRILVTHGVAFLRDADQVVVMEDGRISEIGTYEDLMESKEGFAKFMEESKTENEKQMEENTEGEGHLCDADDFLEDYDDTDLSIADNTAIETTILSRQFSTVSNLSRRSLHRRLSKKREELKTQVSEIDENKLIRKETVETGKVKLSVYKQYVQSATYFLSFGFAFFFAVFSGLQLGRSVWLSQWADANDEMHSKNDTEMSLGERLGVYAAFGVAEALSFFLAMLSMVFGGLSASRNLHSPMLRNLMRSPMSFFDTTPIGRILNRFGKDIDVVDSLLPLNFRYFVMCIFQVFTTLLIIVISTPIFAIVIIPLAIIYIISLRFYVPTSRQLKRLESVNRSPIYSHFSESVQGAASIRAFGKVGEFCQISADRVDRFVRCKYHNLIANRWLAVRLEFIGNCVVLFAALFGAFSNHWGFPVSAGIIGLSISYALNITEVLNFAVRQISELETNIVSVERLKEYSETSTEAEWRVEGSSMPPGWPMSGKIELTGYSTRYRPGLELVVRGLTVDVRGGEKIGIVGRTGAGKSSLTLALFRMIEPADGKIVIDGIDVAKIGLHELRGNLTIIPQDPVLFSGTLRFNLDPFRRYSDDQIWTALELAHLKTFAKSLAGGLEYVITEGGDNISVGQRQLVCLARALLRRSKVLVLDEATAAVDLATDALIQETIRREFKESSVLTIAHRLNTILDYDRVLVLDNGEMKEFGEPDALLSDPSSAFYSMATDAKLVADSE